MLRRFDSPCKRAIVRPLRSSGCPGCEAGTANHAVCRISAQVREPASQGRRRGQHRGRAGGIMPMWRFPGFWQVLLHDG
ncbi:Uncharacterised protein [Bordetella pertussis]|nr:Uncharacterised protein [Bordetella pertussis]